MYFSASDVNSNALLRFQARINDTYKSASVLLACGATLHFIAADFIEQFQLTTHLLPHPMRVIIGSSDSTQITHITSPIHLHFREATFTAQFYVFPRGKIRLIEKLFNQSNPSMVATDASRPTVMAEILSNLSIGRPTTCNHAPRTLASFTLG
jgi:hypothetical protein